METTYSAKTSESANLLEGYRGVALMTAFTAICAQFAAPLPFTPVPVTLQCFAVLLSGLLLGAKRGALAQAQYLLLGCLGAPVFAMAHGGAHTLIGITGGYLLAYPFAAFLAGWAFERISEKGCCSGFVAAMTACVPALAVIYISGTAVMMIVGHLSFSIALIQGTLGFLLWDAMKAGAAAVVAANRRLQS